MPPFFREDFVSTRTAVALVGRSLYGEQWNGPGNSQNLYSAIADFKKELTNARQLELWPTIKASSPLMRRRARQLLGAGSDEDGAALQLVSLGDTDIKAINDKIETKFAEELARDRRYQHAEEHLIGLFCSAQVTTTLLAPSGNRYEMPCEFWASDEAKSTIDAGEASYNPAIYNCGPFVTLQGHVLVPKADLIEKLAEAPRSGSADPRSKTPAPQPKPAAESTIREGSGKEPHALYSEAKAKRDPINEQCGQPLPNTHTNNKETINDRNQRWHGRYEELANPENGIAPSHESIFRMIAKEEDGHLGRKETVKAAVNEIRRRQA